MREPRPLGLPLTIIFLIAFPYTKSDTQQQLCKQTQTCECFNNLDHFEYQCSSGTDAEIVVHVYPNSWIKLDCTDSESLSIKELPEVEFQNIERLQIRYCPVPINGIRELVDHFGMKNVQVLSFTFGIVDNNTLSTEKFKGLSNVTDLRLRSNDLKDIEDNFFDNFPNLVSLELDRNQLQLKSGILLSKLKKLKFLTLSDNSIESLPDQFFDGLDSLEQLNLWKNKLRSVSKTTFIGLANLKSLELAFNEIEKIEDTAFLELPKLVNISIRSNGLKEIKRELFESNVLLEHVELSNNPEIVLQDGVFSNFKSLKFVDLSNNKLSNLSETIFENSTSLEVISLDKNQFDNISVHTFKNLKNLRELSLAFNKLKYLEDGSFQHLTNLEKLDLQHNHLEEIDGRLLKNLVNLKEINLNYNNIDKIHLEAFGRNKKITKISLSHNRYFYKFEGVYPVSPFNKCGDLQEVDLSYNEIIDFPEDLMFLAAMKSVDLSWNKITSLRVNSLWKVTVSELKLNLEHNLISRLDFSNVEITALQQPNLDAYHNAGAAAVVNIQQNPVICDCFAFDFVKYIRNEMYPGVKTSIYFIYDDLHCVSPDILEGILISDVTPAMLSCQIEEVIDNFTCTSIEKCSCAWRPYDYSVVVDCASRNLTVLPEIYRPQELIFNQTEVHLEGNFLTKGPTNDDVGYENVSKLFLTNNLINSIDWIPPKLEILDIRGNELEKIEYEILEKINRTIFTNISLGSNPWRCDCHAANFTNFLRQHVHQIDTRNIFCKGTSQLLMNLNEKDLCPRDLTLLIAATTIILLLCIFTTLAALYYKYQQEIKVWMYAHNILLFLIKEEELDKDKIYDAFISYSHKDEEFVIDNLINVLESGPHPYKLCVHFRNWIPGEFIATQVTSSVADSKRTLVVLSPSFLESVWGKMEFRTAHTEAMKEGRARVIIVLLGDIDMDSLDEELKAYMKTNTYIKWGDPWFWEKLKYALPHSKIKGVDNRRTQKHANMMKYIEDKFTLVNTNNGKSSVSESSSSVIPTSNVKKNGIEEDSVENSIITHEIT